MTHLPPVFVASGPTADESIIRHPTAWLAVLLALRLILSVTYSLAIPPGEAPDEADHFAYAAYILEEGRLPGGPELTQAKHPPLYYVVAAVAGKVAGGAGDRSFLRSNPDMGFGSDAQASNFFVHTTAESWPWRDGVLTIRAGRFVSILAGLVFVLATYLLGRSVWPRRPELGLMAAAFAAFLPESLFISGAMSNDMFAAMWATLALWLALYARNWLHALFAGACLGLAFVSKASTGTLALIVGAALFLSTRSTTTTRFLTVRALLPAAVRVMAAGLAALLIALPWLLRNWRLYGDPFGWPIVLATIDRRAEPLGVAEIAQLLKGWWLSFWGKFGGAGHILLPTILYLIWAVLGIAAVAGWIAWLARRRQPDNLLRETSLAGWIVLLGAPVVTMAGIYSYSQTALGTDQGRLLFPALGALALLIAGGLAAWIPEQHAWSAAVAFAGGMAVIAVAALFAGLIQPFAPQPAPTAAEVARATPVRAAFGPVELVGVAWDQPQNGALTLYWRAVEPVRDDLRTALRLVDADGRLLWEWKRSPGAGRFSTDHWPLGRVVADVYWPQPAAVAQAARAEVGVRPFPEGAWLPVNNSTGDSADTLLAIPR